MNRIRRGIQWVVDLLFPIWCVSCRKEGEWWCEACSKKQCNPVQSAEGSLVKLVALFEYDEEQPIGKLIRLYKYNHAHGLKELWYRLVYLPEELQGATLVPVPLWPSRERERGFNQATLIAEQLANKYHLPLLEGLKRARSTGQQAKLDRAMRLSNMVGAFAWDSTKKIPDTIILVDDVYTTGATMQNCAKELLANGAKEVYGFVLARG